MADTESAWLADFLGYIASISFTIQYIPQTIHNYRRKTMLGFSAIGMISLCRIIFLILNLFAFQDQSNIQTFKLLIFRSILFNNNVILTFPFDFSINVS